MIPVSYVGFDPGGKNAFGWAVLSALHGKLTLTGSGTCSSAPDAVSGASRFCAQQPLAFSVDSPLFWIEAGDRNADKVVRKMVCGAGGQGGTVSHVNSLVGACVVQGLIVSQIASKRWPAAHITEAHPKALLRISSEAKAFAELPAHQKLPDHERDASLAAFAAFKFASSSEGWHDLALLEENPLFPTGIEVSYWFPKAQN